MFLGTFPLEDACPAETVKVLEDTCCIDDYVILAVVDQDLGGVQHDCDIGGDTSGYILTKSSVDVVVTGQVVDSYAKLGFVLVQKLSKRFVEAIIVPEIEHTDISEVGLRSGIIIGQEVKIISSFLIITIVDVKNSISLEPSADISEFALHYSHRPKIRIIVVNLVYWISPAVTDTYTG